MIFFVPATAREEKRDSDNHVESKKEGCNTEKRGCCPHTGLWGEQSGSLGAERGTQSPGHGFPRDVRKF